MKIWLSKDFTDCQTCIPFNTPAVPKLTVHVYGPCLCACSEITGKKKSNFSSFIFSLNVTFEEMPLALRNLFNVM